MFFSVASLLMWGWEFASCEKRQLGRWRPGWGLFPEWDAMYLNYSGGQSEKSCYSAIYNVPENNAFWSITVYGDDGFMKSNNNIVNSSTVQLDTDSTFAMFFGSEEV